MFVGEERNIGYNVPFEADITGDIKGVLQINSEPVPNNRIAVNLNKPFTVLSNETRKFNVHLKLLGWLPIKKVQVEVINPENYIPVGEMVGVTVSTDGVLVLGTGNLINPEGKKASPSKDILFSGDYIKKINQKTIVNKEELIKEINASDGKEVLIEIERKDETMSVKVKPSNTSIEGEYKLGVWVRDDTQGIGTLTYINLEKNTFGALGHGITDVDTQQLMELSGGTLVTSLITNITKGKDGAPGEIAGVIIESEENTVAFVNQNHRNGIFGSLTKNGIEMYSNKECLSLGFKYDIKLGKALIRSDVSGDIRDYEIVIEKIFLNDEANKGMIIKVVDTELLNLTNGIIQGMSGSPIIQDGKLIGAVTHVFVQDSTKGYGTFIENMILEEN
jgi:stage IV sporulation protein B